MHVSCSAPETMHLCQKYGYERLVSVEYENCRDEIEASGSGKTFEELASGLYKESV